MSTLSQRWKNTSRVFRVLLLVLLVTLLLLLCLLVILQFLPDIWPPSKPTVDFSSATYSVDEGADTATITVNLSAASSVTVTVEYATSDGTATADEDYTAASGILTFDPNVTEQTFTVTIIDDNQDEAEEETINLTLANASNANIGGNSPATLTIFDNDEPLPTVDFSSANYNVREDAAAGTAIITVTLSTASDQTVTVDYATSDNMALAGSDYTATSGTLTFNPGDTSQTFAVAIIDDDLEEVSETLKLTLSNASNATIGGNSPATLTILDDDRPVTVGFSSETYTVDEGASTATITVTLNIASEQTVTVDYATSDGTATAGEDYSTVSGALTFSPGDTDQAFTVPIIDDDLEEANETVRLSLANANNATIDRGQATLTIRDNELPKTETIAPEPTETVTPVKIGNVLRNGNFEEGFQPNELGKYWDSFNNGSAHFSYHIDDWPLVVVEGEHTQLIEIKEAVKPDRYLGIYQTAKVIPGEVYTFSMRGLIRTNTGDVEKTNYGYRLQVGFDLSGGQDWEEVEDWIELLWDEQLRVQDSFRFDVYTTTLSAESEELTVFIRAWKKWADSGEGDYDVDDIQLVGPVPVTVPSPAIPVTGDAPGTIWDNVRVWATVGLLLLLLAGAIWRLGWKRTS